MHTSLFTFKCYTWSHTSVLGHTVINNIPGFTFDESLALLPGGRHVSDFQSAYKDIIHHYYQLITDVTFLQINVKGDAIHSHLKCFYCVIHEPHTDVSCIF